MNFLDANDLHDEYGMAVTSKKHPFPEQRDRVIGDMNHYRVTLHRPDRDAAGRHMDRRLTIDYSKGKSLDGEPTLGEVIECLAGDAASIVGYLPEGWENGDVDFEMEDFHGWNGWREWGTDLGYDMDDRAEARRAESLFHRVRRQSQKFLAWLPEGVTLERLGY